MYAGKDRAGEVWVDLTGTRTEHISIEEDGFAVFLSMEAVCPYGRFQKKTSNNLVPSSRN